MTDSDYEIVIDPENARHGYAALAYEEDGEYIVNGVALGNGDVTEGMSGRETVWPGEVLQDAADLLVGTPITVGTVDQAHPGAEKDETGLSVADEAPDEATIGEVTKARWDDALGLLWQGRITDEEVADQVERGEIDVSPVVSRDIELVDEEAGRWEATAIHGFRDLTALPPSIPGAAPSNSIEPGMAEALASAFDDGGRNPAAVADENDFTTTEIMDELTDEEMELLSVIRQSDEPTVIEKEDAEKLPQAAELLSAAEDIDGEAKLVSESEYETLQGHVETVEEMLDEALVDQRGLRKGTVEAMSFDAKASEFEAEDGGLDAEALVQTPETGDVTEEEEVEQEALSAEEKEEVELLVKKAERMERFNPDFAAEKVKQAAEALSLDVEEPSVADVKEAL